MEKEKFVLSVDFILSVDQWLYNISENNWLIAIKFHVKFHFDGGKVVSGFAPDWIKTLVSMATDSSHRTIIGKTFLFLFSQLF